MAQLRQLIWRLTPPTWRTFQIVGSADAVDEIPEWLPRKGAAIVESSAGPQWLAFDCPCTEAHRVVLNLNPRRRPAWRVDANNPLTLFPSVDQVRGAKVCHYIVRNGKVRWVPYNVNGDNHDS